MSSFFIISKLETLHQIHKVPQTYPNLNVDELDADKLNPLLKLRYNNALNDAMADLGDAVQVIKAFVESPRYLYSA